MRLDLTPRARPGPDGHPDARPVPAEPGDALLPWWFRECPQLVHEQPAFRGILLRTNSTSHESTFVTDSCSCDDHTRSNQSMAWGIIQSLPSMHVLTEMVMCKSSSAWSSGTVFPEP